MRILFLLAFAVSTFGQITQSIVIPANGQAANGSIPAMSTGDFRMEFLLQNWATTVDNSTVADNPGAAVTQFLSSQQTLFIYWAQGNSGTGPCVGAGKYQVFLSLFSVKAMYVRYQRSFSGNSGAAFPALTDSLEAWDSTGTRVFSDSCTYTSTGGSASAGAQVGSIGSTVADTFGFFRVYNTLVKIGSQMPVTTPASSAGCVFHWKFDNSLDDDCNANQYPATLTNVPCAANACYASTGTIQNLAVASARTDDAPAWGDWRAMKVGSANTLDGTQSFSQNAATSAVTYSWSQDTSTLGCTGGGTATPSSSSAAKPTVTPPSFGPYCYGLQVTDSNGNMATTTLIAGAVAMDANGVVTNSSDATKLFGPMIAYGYNPWGFVDERHRAMVPLQQTYQTTIGYNPPPFTTKGTGTISYKYGGSPACTGLSAGINSTTLSIPVTNASCLDLGTLPTTPTVIFVGNEMIRICSQTAGTPPAATLNACYDGRGVARGSWGYGGTISQNGYNQVVNVSGTTVSRISGASFDATALTGAVVGINGNFSYTVASVTNANVLELSSTAGTVINANFIVKSQPWPSATVVGDQMTTGTSTLFATDSSRAVCPAGVPGPPGLVAYSTGTLTMSAGSAVVTGSGTTWTTGNGVISGNMIRIEATHASGTTFIFIAVINSVDSTTQLTLSRPAPSDIDGTGFSYKVTSVLYYSPMTAIPGSSPTAYTNIARNLEICESETRLSSSLYYEASPIQALGLQSGLQYSYKTQVGVTSFTFQNNYYGAGLAARAFYLRSGYLPAKTLADNIDENWIIDPEVVAGYGINFGIRVAGGFIGAMADKVTNGSTALVFPQFRQFGTASGVLAAAHNCASGDTRDTGTTESFAALLALFDTAQQSTWNSILYNNTPDSWYTWDQACKGSDNSWANGGYFNDTFARVTLMPGNKNVTANSGTFSSDRNRPDGCTGTATGTGTVTAGSDIFTRSTGTFSVGAYQIAITGTRLGSPYTLYTSYRIDNSNQLTLVGKWPADADAGPVDWTTFASPGGGLTPYQVTSFAVDAGDTAALTENFICTYVDSGTVTLNRNWPITDTNNSLRHIYTGLGGRGQQPFMLGGGKSLGLQWAALNSDSTIANAFNGLLQNGSTWMRSTGFDTYSLGPFAARVFQADEPLIVPSSSYLGELRANVGQAGVNVDALVATRELTGEVATTLRAYFAGQGNSADAKTWGDQQYGALYGSSNYNTGGVYSDANTAGNNIGRSNLTDGYLISFKWPGFFFGMGMAHQWPAIRLGLPSNAGGTVTGGVVSEGGTVAH